MPLLVLLISLTASVTAQLPPGTTDASTSQSSTPDPLRTQAAEAIDKHDFPTARRLLNTLTEKNPADAALLYNLGFTDEALGNEPEAAEAYRKSIAADPAYLPAHLALGLLLARQGKLAEAHAELAKSVTLQTPDATLKARAWRALARLDQPTDPTAAGADLLEALKLSPESVDDALLAGELAEAAHDLPAAEAAYRRILATHPDDPNAPAVTAAIAHLLLSLKRAPEAETLLTEALKKHPDDPILISQLAAADAAQSKTADAIALIEKLHAASPTNANVTRLLAHLYSDDKQPEKAAPLYADLLVQSPNDPALLADQGQALLHLHHYAEAQSALLRAVADPKAFPNPADLGNTAENLAFAASQNNSPEITLQALAIRARVLPQSPVSLFLAATAHDTLHHSRQASELYKQFLTAAAGKFPDQEWEASHRLIALEHTR